MCIRDSRTDFCTFLPSQILRGAVPPKVVLALTPHLEARQVPKFRRATPPNSQVIMAHLFLFKPIFDPPLKKVVRRAPVPGGGCASKTWSFSSACKNLGAQRPLWAEIWSFEKVDLGGYDYDSTSRSPQLVDQSSPDFFRRTRE